MEGAGCCHDNKASLLRPLSEGGACGLPLFGLARNMHWPVSSRR